jgi:hypothetical protein
MMVKSLIARDQAASRCALTEQGRAVLAALLANGERWRESAFGRGPEKDMPRENFEVWPDPSGGSSWAGFATLTSINAFAADPLPTETTRFWPPIWVEAAQAAIAARRAQGYGVSVVVADRTGRPKV